MKITTICTLLAVVAFRRWHLWKIDVKNAFLHDDLQETVFMKPPPGMFVLRITSIAYLNFSIVRSRLRGHDLKIFEVPFFKSSSTKSNHDNSLFIKRTHRGCTLLLLYVDHMIISGNYDSGIAALKLELMKIFKMKDLGPVTYFLGLEITHSKDGIQIRQKKYAEDLLSLAHLTDSKESDTPLELNAKLSKN